MANELTSIASGVPGGIAENLVKPAYDLYLREALNGSPTFRQFVSVRPNHPSFTGSSITLQRFNWFDESVVTAAKTPLNEETDVDSTKVPATTPVVITPKEYGFAVTETKLLKNRRMIDFDPQVARAVSDHAGKVIDELIQDTLVGGGTILTATGGAENALTKADVLKAQHVRDQVTEFRSGNVPGYSGEWFTAVTHPRVVHDLRTETGSGAWRVPNEYGTSQTKIWNGEFGEFEGVRFIQNTRTRNTATGASGAKVFHTFFFGNGGLAEHVVEEPTSKIGPVVDKLGRFRTVGWYADLGWAVYEPTAIRIVKSGSSKG